MLDFFMGLFSKSKRPYTAVDARVDMSKNFHTVHSITYQLKKAAKTGYNSLSFSKKHTPKSLVTIFEGYGYRINETSTEYIFKW